MPLPHSKNISNNFSKNNPVEEVLFHADTQTDKRTDRHNDCNSTFSQFFVWFNET